MLLKIILILVIFKGSLGEQNYTEITELMKSLILKENVPTKITAFLCWPNHVQVQFLKQLSYSGLLARIGKFDIEYSFPPEHHIVMMDLDCQNAETILNQVKKMDIVPSRWTFWGSNNESSMLRQLQELYFRIDSQVYLTVKLNSTYHIKSIYKLDDSSDFFIENDIAKWSSDRGFTTFNVLCGPKNRTDFKGTAVKLSYVITNNDTLNHLEDYRFIHIDPLSKLNWIMVHHLMSMVNATPSSIFRSTWGYKDATTNLFSGMIGDLQIGNAELGGTASFFTVDRIDVVDFVTPSAPTYMRFIFRAPPLSYTTNIFTLPFDTWVWYCSFILAAVILLVVYIIVLWEWRDPVFRKKLEEKHDGNMAPLRPGIVDVFLMEIGAITQQGYDSEPKSHSGRIATVFTFVALMFLYTSYSANIVALLQSTTESIRTLEDLLHSRISLGVEDIVYAHYYFENAKEPVRKSIYDQKIAPKGQKPNFMSVQEGVKRVQKGFFGFHAELSTSYKVVADTFQEHEKCGLKEISFVSLVEPWVPMKKKSPFKEIFKVGMQKIYESGIKRREINRIYMKKPVCHSKGSNFGSAGLLDCYAAFLIFGVGIGCSVISFILEVLLNKFLDKKVTLMMVEKDVTEPSE